MILREIAYQRSGDKGDNVEVSLFPHKNVSLSEVEKNLIEEKIRKHLSNYKFSSLIINKYEKLNFVQLVFLEILEGGVSVNKKMDRNGKALGDVILEMEI
ncbi:MAG: hypothetical protein PT934_03050 [Peptoniphilaceae bacterium]|uniref:AtuA-related protein n=1 Tax=Parvimonas sp. TaxID=1944660 RepID=UPI0025FD9AA8|nr:hypothetical protein [Parvimonas sp.]MCI5997671.1 hypothetical protein [Parvimonas sp.]MDD7764730.1 hypothetical protein [Peptoniphilaceae bacterium]MDY3051176.1 hypothetical protein [Parvimonas sp.]